MSIEWIANKASGRKGGVFYVSVAVSKSGLKAGPAQEQAHALCIRFSVEAIKDLRLIYGDRLLIGLDPVSKQVCYKRTTEPGKGIKLSKHKGTPAMLVQIKVDLPWMQSTHVAKAHVHAEAAHVAIDCPELFAGAAAK